MLKIIFRCTTIGIRKHWNDMIYEMMQRLIFSIFRYFLEIDEFISRSIYQNNLWYVLQNMTMQTQVEAKGMQANCIEQVDRQHEQLPVLFS